MITNDSAKEMTIAAVIKVQEKTGREHGYHLVPKLGTYWDELSAVCGEMKRRQDGVK